MPRAYTLRSSALLAFLLLACAPIEPESATEAAPDLLPSLQVYTVGSELTFVLQVLNTTEEPIELTFPTGQRFDFVVLEGDREIWRWSDEMSFTQAVGVERVEPGESLRYEVVWRPTAASVAGLEVVGTLTASDRRVEQSARIASP